MNPPLATTTPTKRSFAGWCLGTVWLLAVFLGFRLVIDFDMTPGEAGIAPQQRPAGVVPREDADRPTLMLFAHPRCPCTKAALGELNRVLTACPGLVDVRVYFRTPENPSQEWTNTALWQDASVLPGTTVTADEGGVLAREFDIKTSGHVLLYSPEGRLLYSGGITAARGEEGDNPGRSAVVALIKGGGAAQPEFHVYGCPLFNPAEECRSEDTCRKP